ncbi:hypothetical protein FF38_06106 [Lucilia cuprina]|uniref:Uncharacterized protein n=1 Tax=Lucilia cuprina TaxID=7375 RepID=A0A0L0CCN0_LUCCU|nr:hypothetical protein FF38_06106 [Lucilia cuprina]
MNITWTGENWECSRSLDDDRTVAVMGEYAWQVFNRRRTDDVSYVVLLFFIVDVSLLFFFVLRRFFWLSWVFVSCDFWSWTTTSAGHK